MVRPIWYVLPDEEPIVDGPHVPGEKRRSVSVMVGFNPDERTRLFIYGYLKDGVSWRSAFERPHVGLPGQVVWRQHISSGGDEWDIDMYNDGSGYTWTIRQDPEHAEVGMAQSQPTTNHALAAVVQHLEEEHGVHGLRGIIPPLE
jgi:hypothetical protein